MKNSWEIMGNAVRIPVLVFLCILGLLAGCGRHSAETVEEFSSAQTEAESAASGESLRIGLVLTSRDDPENEAVQEAFQTLEENLGAEISVKTPDVSAKEADEARTLAYHTFVLCDVNPIEYQMLAVDELIAEDADIIAIHANHKEALESVLAAARKVGVRVIAFEEPVTDASFDIYTDTAEEAVDAIKETEE